MATAGVLHQAVTVSGCPRRAAIVEALEEEEPPPAATRKRHAIGRKRNEVPAIFPELADPIARVHGANALPSREPVPRCPEAEHAYPAGRDGPPAAHVVAEIARLIVVLP